LPEGTDSKQSGQLFWYHTFKELGLDVSGVDSLEGVRWKAKAIPDNLNGKSVLDIGTWDGYFAFLCERRGASRVVAIDNLAHGWGMATFEYAKSQLSSKVEFRKADIRYFDVGEKFDVVLYMGVYYHMPDPYSGFGKISLLTRDLAVIEGACEPSNDSFLRWMIGSHPDPTYFWRPSLPCLKNMLLHTGFHSVDIVDFKGDRVLLRAYK
jgi:tRNA (mo5U34)-methyltransferase